MFTHCVHLCHSSRSIKLNYLHQVKCTYPRLQMLLFGNLTHQMECYTYQLDIFHPFIETTYSLEGEIL